MLFFAPGHIGSQNHEFALMGFTDPPIGAPEPGTLMLFGLGLLSLGAARRGKRL